ncbi:MAG: hypothetical protein A3I78_05405 [Gammaproteobacteria bacterium RIFCSPLOWO2_02_FULL_56_15]|nr:MAG: hypothetical protein A3I78_05405 [Gammaproteobacteria bacterium RIFCSPLOWO2_02_FULL_56_15]
MKRLSGPVFTGLFFLYLFQAPVYGHHSGAPYDANTQITLEGEVVDWSWRNPHTSLQLKVTGTDGKAVVWIIEGTSPNILVRQGWKRTSLNPGDKVQITVHPLRDGKPGGSLLGAVLVDGAVLGATPGSSGRSLSAGDSGGAKE